MPSLDQIRTFFQKDRYAMNSGIEILSAQEGRAVCRMPITPEHLNAGGVAQGGAVFTLADFCFAVASNASGELVVSLDNQISFIRPAAGAYLTAQARPVSAGRSAVFYQVDVTDDRERLVAQMTVTGFPKHTPLDMG